MKQIVYSPQALLDLDNIWDYSADNWGIEHADAYAKRIRETCQCLGEGSLIGQHAGDIRPSY